PRLLETAKGYGDVVGVVTVHVHHAGTQCTRHAMRRGQVAGPHGSGKAVAGVVGDGQCLGLILECDGRQYRPEDLLPRDAHVGSPAIEHRRFDEAAATVLAHLRTTERNTRSILPADVDVAQHTLHLLRIDDGTHFRGRIERIAGYQLAPDLCDL